MDARIEESASAYGSHSEPYAKAPFDGRRFSNASGNNAKGLSAVFRWMLTRKRTPWPRAVPVASIERPDLRVDDATIQITLIGHSAVLIQAAGLNIITDPMLSSTAGPLAGVGVRRAQPPALRLADLPPIDVILLSHNHYDHLDRPSLRSIAARDNPLVVTGIGVGRSVPTSNVIELNWWESHALDGGARVTFVPAEHFSARGPFDRNASLWGGFVIESRLGTVYFAGDTAAGEHFALIRRRFGPISVALLPIGAYEPRWFMKDVHMDPEDAVSASTALEAKISIAIHHGTFQLTDEAIDAAVRGLKSALALRGEEQPDFRVIGAGARTVIQRREF